MQIFNALDQKLPCNPYASEYFDAIPHQLRTSSKSEDPDIILFLNVSGCGVQIRSVCSPRVPWLLTVFLTDANDLYFENSISLTSQQAKAGEIQKAKVEGATSALWWMMCVKGRAGCMTEPIAQIIQHLRQLITETAFSDQLNESHRSGDAQYIQLSLF
jgi:hypothetical protein